MYHTQKQKNEHALVCSTKKTKPNFELSNKVINYIFWEKFQSLCLSSLVFVLAMLFYPQSFLSDLVLF